MPIEQAIGTSLICCRTMTRIIITHTTKVAIRNHPRIASCAWYACVASVQGIKHCTCIAVYGHVRGIACTWNRYICLSHDMMLLVFLLVVDLCVSSGLSLLGAM